MNQKKIGAFLKALRREKGITQEQLAEILGVSGRTVSRWETGFNLPDLDILIQIADYYEVEIREILDGERKEEKMNKELEETVLKVADYSNREKQGMAKKVNVFLLCGIVSMTGHLILEYFGYEKGFPGGFFAGLTLGLAYGAMILGALYLSGHLMKFRAFKMRALKRK